MTILDEAFALLNSSQDFTTENSAESLRKSKAKKIDLHLRLQGGDVYSAALKIGELRGEIFDRHNRKVGGFKGQSISDEHGRLIATVRGNDVYDTHGIRVTTVSAVKNSFDSINDLSLVALFLLLQNGLKESIV